uniref:Cilia- and flagella-associated protein 57 n=1 Tax=Spongospora subterranea TaxID=70186 RepID=A0A0H5RQX8_9EUKA|eukprot:CRZ11124.1 hypothetical protein [Spongospora subterranea]
MSSAPVITHTHTLGLAPDVLSNLHFIDENIILYPAGHSVVIYNAEKKTQRFIFISEGSHITTLALSPNRRFVGIAEASDRAIITVFDVQTLRKRKVINSGQIMQYVWMNFSPDGKLLLTLGSSPDYLLTNWMWEKIRPLHSVKAASGAGADDAGTTASPAMYQCSFCLHDPTLVVAIGNGRVSWYRLSSTMQLDPIRRDCHGISKHDFICHTWIRDSLVLGTRAGLILLCGPSGAAFISQIDLRSISGDPQSGPDLPVLSLISFNRGLACGTLAGQVFLFETLLHDNDQVANLSAAKRLTLRSSTPGDVTNMALNPTEQLLAVTTSSSSAYFVSLTNSDILKADEMKFEPLLEPFHSGAIVGMDVCIRKPLVITCGLDCSVRVWNYLDRTTECVKIFPEACLSVAIHPSGFQVMIGFTDKLRLMNLLLDDIRPCKEINVKNCREVQFSAGGHMFAAVHGSLILVYSTYTCELISTLRGHNQRVSSIEWVHDDMTIITSGSDGAIYEFASRSGQREREYVQKGCKYYSAVGTQDGKIYAVGNDRVLKEIADSAVQKELDSGTILTQIVLSRPPERMLFTGSENGVIRSFKFPLTGHCQDYQCHSAAVSRLRLSRDDTMLFSAGMDGTMSMFEVREQEGRQVSSLPLMPWSEEVLVTRSDLEERATLTNELKNKVDELTLHNEYQLRLQEMSHNDKLKEIKEVYHVALEEEKRIYDQVKDAKQDMEMEYEEAIKRLEEVQAETLQLAKQEHQDQIMKEVELYHDLERQMKREEEEWAQQMSLANEQHQDALDMRQVDLEELLTRERERLDRLSEEKEAITREFKETKRQLEQDTDVEILELKEKFDQSLATERETTLRLKGENGIMKKRFSSLSNDIEDQKEELKLMMEKEGAVREQISVQRHEIELNKAQINGLDATIGDKERTIYELKKRNQEMEKHKFVLDYQIKELKREIEPRECKIADMQEQEDQIDGALEQLHSDNGRLREAVAALKDEIASVQAAMNESRHLAQQYATEAGRQMFDLDRAVHLGNQDELVAAVKDAIARYARSDATAAASDPQVLAEYSRQSSYLRGRIATLKTSVQVDSVRHRRETHRIMQQNDELIKEINSLRRELEVKRQGVKPTGNLPDQQTIWEKNQEKIASLKGELAIGSG